MPITATRRRSWASGFLTAFASSAAVRRGPSRPAADRAAASRPVSWKNSRRSMRCMRGPRTSRERGVVAVSLGGGGRLGRLLREQEDALLVGHGDVRLAVAVHVADGELGADARVVVDL